MEFSTWSEVVIHPATGERTLLQADTVEQLERKIETFMKDAGSPDAAPRRVGDGVRRP